MDKVGVHNKLCITNYEVFAKEYLKRKRLWKRTPSLARKADDLISMAEALGVNINIRTMYSFCSRFKRVHEKKVRASLMHCIEKKIPPELALKRSGIATWVREVEAELKVLPRLIQEYRVAGLLPEDKSHVLWQSFATKMVEHIHKIRRMPKKEDVVSVAINCFGVTESKYDLFDRLWKRQEENILFKYRRLFQSGDKPSETVSLTQLEWRIMDVMAMYVPGFLDINDNTFKWHVQVKQLVELYYLVNTYKIEENNSKENWARVVRAYSRNCETSPSGIILQLRWHELRLLTRNNIQTRITDNNHRVHPLMVEIATRYPHVLSDSVPWRTKVLYGSIHDVTNFVVHVDQLYLDEDEQDEMYNSERASDKNAEVDSDFDSDDEQPLVIVEKTKHGATTSNNRTKSTELSIPDIDLDKINEPTQTFNDKTDTKINLSAVERYRNEEVIRLDDELNSQLSCIISDNTTISKDNMLKTYSKAYPVMESKPNPIVIDSKDKPLKNSKAKPLKNSKAKPVKRYKSMTVKDSEDDNAISVKDSLAEPVMNLIEIGEIDDLEGELQKLDKELNEQLIALKNLKLPNLISQTNDIIEDETDIDSKIDNLSTKIKMKSDKSSFKIKTESYKDKYLNDSSTSQSFKATNRKRNIALKSTAGSSHQNTSHVKNNKNNEKLETERKTDDKNTNSESKSVSLNELGLAGINALVYTCKDPNGVEIGHVLVPNPILKDVVSLSLKTNDGVINIKSNVINDPAMSNSLDISKDNGSQNVSNESDLDLLQKIDPSQAQTVILFSDSENEGDSLPNGGENDQVKEVFNLNDVKKYLNNHSLDDILTKMDGINVKKEPTNRKDSINRGMTSYIYVSDSDDEMTRNEIGDAENDVTIITDSSMDNGAANMSVDRDETCPIDVDDDENCDVQIKSNENSTLPVPNPNIDNQLDEVVRDLNKNLSDAISLIEIEKELNDLSNLTKINPTPTKVSKNPVANENQNNVPSGLSLFRLQDKTSKETVGVLINVKNAMSTSQLETEVSKQLLYLNEDNNKDENINDKKDEYYKIINKKIEIDTMKENSRDGMLKRMLESNNTTTLWTSEVKDNKHEQSMPTSIDPKLIMDARVYLPKLDEIESYNKNRRVNYSINTKRISILGYKILNYKRKSDEPIRIQDDIESEISVASKRKLANEKLNVATKRRRISDDKSITTSKTPDVAEKAKSDNSKTEVWDNLLDKIKKERDVQSLIENNFKSSDSYVRTNIVQRIKFETDDDSQLNDDHSMNDVENDNIDVLNEKENINEQTENAAISLNEYIVSPIMLPRKDIGITTTDENAVDKDNSNYESEGSDEMELETLENNTLILDSSKAQISDVNVSENDQKEKESNTINSDNVNLQIPEFTNDTNLSSNINMKENSSEDGQQMDAAHNDIMMSVESTDKDLIKENEIDQKPVINSIESPKVIDKIHDNINENDELAVTVKIEDIVVEENEIISLKHDEVNIDPKNDQDNNHLEKDVSLNDDTSLNNLKTLKELSLEENGLLTEIEHHSSDDDDDDDTPINNIAEMLKLCKPVKICLKRVKVPESNIQVRKVELPDRTQLKRHRAPTAHVAPINVSVPLDCGNNGAGTTPTDIGTLLYQLSKETASEWQRLEISMKCNKKPRLVQDHTYVRKDKKRGKYKKSENKNEQEVVKKPKILDPDELILQNKEWQRQKTINNRFFDLKPIYKRTQVVDTAKDAKNKLDKKEALVGQKVDEVKEDNLGELDLAVESIINNKNDYLSNSNAVKIQETDAVIVIDDRTKTIDEKQKIRDYFQSRNLEPQINEQLDNRNELTPIFTKVQVHKEENEEVHKEENEVLVPIATPVKLSFVPIISIRKPSMNNFPQKKQVNIYGNMYMAPKKSSKQNSKDGIFSTSDNESTMTSHEKRLGANKWFIGSEDSETVKGNHNNNTDSAVGTVGEIPPAKSLSDIKEATKRMQNSIKECIRRIKSKTDQPIETITLSDSDTEDATKPESPKVIIDKFETDEDNIETNVNPPFKVMESTVTKNSKSLLRMMEIGPIDSAVLEKIDNILNEGDDKGKDNGPKIKNVQTVSSFIDLDDSSNEDRNEAQTSNDSEINSIAPGQILLENSQENVMTGQMPRITNVTSILPSNTDIASNNEHINLNKPMNSEEEYLDSDIDELHIDESLMNSGDEDIMRAESEISSHIHNLLSESSNINEKINEVESPTSINNLKITKTDILDINPENIKENDPEQITNTALIPPSLNSLNNMKIEENAYADSSTDLSCSYDNEPTNDNVTPDKCDENINNSISSIPDIDKNKQINSNNEEPNTNEIETKNYNDQNIDSNHSNNPEFEEDHSSTKNDENYSNVHNIDVNIVETIEEIGKDCSNFPKIDGNTAESNEEIGKDCSNFPKIDGNIAESNEEIGKDCSNFPKIDGNIAESNEEIVKDCNNVPKIDGNIAETIEEIGKDCSNVPNIDENIAETIEEIGKDCSNVPKIDGNIAETIEEIGKDCSNVPKIDGNTAESNEEIGKDCSNFPKIDEKIAETNEENEKTDTNNEEIPKQTENVTEAIASGDAEVCPKETEKTDDGKKDTTENDSQPRPFLKLVPIQKLLGERKVLDEPNIFEDNKLEDAQADESVSDEANAEIEEPNAGTLGAKIEEPKMRGEPIPFLCSSQGVPSANLPMISNVVSLTSVPKKVSQKPKSRRKQVLQPVLKFTNIDFNQTKDLDALISEEPSTSESSGQQLNRLDVSVHPPILVADYIKNRDCTNISLLCIDGSKPLWKVYRNYIIVTNLKLPLIKPTYWSMGGRKKCYRVIMDAASEGSTVVGQLSVPDEVFLDNNWYRKLSTDPMIYAKLWFVVPNSKTCQDMLNLDMQIYLYSNETGVIKPLVNPTKKPNVKTIIQLVPLQTTNVPNKTDDGEVIALDSDEDE